MLVDINFNMQREVQLLNILDVIAELNGNDTTVKQLARGVYEVGHFSFEHEIGISSRDPWDCRYPDVTVSQLMATAPTVRTFKGDYSEGEIVKLAPFMGAEEVELRRTDYAQSYGVCDSWQQVVALCAELQDDHLVPYVMSITEITKADQPESGGWRWHKWGPYIGVHNPQCEYIYDEKDIEKVYVYHLLKMPVRLYGSILQGNINPVHFEEMLRLPAE